MKAEILAHIRAMGWTARRNGFGEIWCQQKDCLHKLEHGFGVETWVDALRSVRAAHEHGAHCCEELNGRCA